MSRPLRFIPEEGAFVDITCRIIQSRYLLRPDPVLADILLACGERISSPGATRRKRPSRSPNCPAGVI
ncbi:MAG TPA: hypothetical protein VN493_05770 [Thermoanaerobaculia bacterium]|nr:hypothetical protein [Thermoanaerobaculia bacterium]